MSHLAPATLADALFREEASARIGVPRAFALDEVALVRAPARQTLASS
jgi:hypothetical protein